MMPAAPVQPMRVEVGGTIGGKRYELVQAPVDTLSESPYFVPVASTFFGLRLIRPLLQLSAFAGGPHEEDRVASVAIAFAWMASIVGILGTIVVSPHVGEWFKQLGASPSFTWNLEPAALALFTVAVFLDLLHQLLALVSWNYFWSTGVEPQGGGMEMLSFVLILLHAAGLIGLLVIVAAYARCFRASWKKFSQGPPEGYANDHRKRKPREKRRPRVDLEEDLEPGKATPVSPSSDAFASESPTNNARSDAGPRQAGTASQPSAPHRSSSAPSFAGAVPRQTGTPPRAWHWNNGEWVPVRILRTMPDGAYAVRLPGGMVVTAKQSLLQPRFDGDEPPPSEPPPEAADHRDQRRPSWGPTREPGRGGATASGRPHSAPPGPRPPGTAEEDSEGAKWAAERLARLRKELQALDGKAAADRRSSLRQLQRELHPDKQPVELRSHAQPLFMIVQKEWEIDEAAAKKAAAEDS